MIVGAKTRNDHPVNMTWENPRVICAAVYCLVTPFR